MGAASGRHAAHLPQVQVSAVGHTAEGGEGEMTTIDKCTRCGKTDLIQGNVCGSCADDLRQQADEPKSLEQLQDEMEAG